MGRIHAERAPAADSSSEDTTPMRAPGKRAPTERTMTGIPMIDVGPFCSRPEQRDNPRCFTPDERVYLIQTFRDYAIIASQNERDAYTEAMIEYATAKGAGWGFWEQLIFDGASYGFGRIFVAGARILAGRVAAGIAEFDARGTLALKIAKVDDKGLLTGYATVARSARSELKHMRSIAKGAEGKKQWISAAREAIGARTRALTSVLPAMLDDDTLAACALSLGDDSLHGVGVYAADLAGAMAQLDAHLIDKIGTPGDAETPVEFAANGGVYGAYEAARVRYVDDGKRRRVGLFRGPTGATVDLIRYADPEMESIVVDTYRARTGMEPDVIHQDNVKVTLTPGESADRQWLAAFLDVDRAVGGALTPEDE